MSQVDRLPHAIAKACSLGVEAYKKGNKKPVLSGRTLFVQLMKGNYRDSVAKLLKRSYNEGFYLAMWEDQEKKHIPSSEQAYVMYSSP